MNKRQDVSPATAEKNMDNMPGGSDRAAKPRTPKEAVSLGPVLQGELAEIKKVRLKRMPENHGNCGVGRPREPAPAPEVPLPEVEPAPEWQTHDKEWVKATEDAHAANLVGLAFSGGGIRSATFNLGALQALAELKLLSRFDYLSTVSGGGYIGGWLAAWTKRRGSFAQVQNRLATNRVHQEDDNEPREIRFLRVFSNYLTPKMGLVSGDTLAAAGIVLRNVLLNQLVLLTVLAALLLLPRAALRWGVPALAALTNREVIGLVAVLLAIAFVVIVNNMIYLTRRGKGKLLSLTRQIHILWVRKVLLLTKQKQILCLVAGPLLGSAILGALWQALRFRAGQGAPIPYSVATYAGVAAYGAVWLLAIVLGSLLQWLQWSARKPKLKQPPKAKRFWPRMKEILSKIAEILRSIAAPFTMVVTAVLAGALAGWLYAWLSEYTRSWSPKADLTFGVPLVLGVFLLTGTLHIGLMGAPFRDSRREWWGRLGGWLMLWGVAWLAFFWLALYFPAFMRTSFVKEAWGAVAAKYLTPAWIMTTAAGLWAAKGNNSGNPGEINWKDWLAKAAPYIFVVGLLCWLSYSIDWIQSKYILEYAKKVAGGGFFVWLPKTIANYRLCAALVGCAVVAVVMSWRLDINQFSMHLLYRNRLVRCFLGASNRRSPNRFTGFDENDDMPLTALTAANDYDGPYPVFNAALNLVKGQDLAWQERKAESFVMTPLYCGYDVWLEEQDSPLLHGDARPKRKAGLERFGYRPTAEYAYPPPNGGINLGTAMAISGAAADPNMGFYTSTPVAFLMTVFNVRLGQWLGNPRRRTSSRATPRIGLQYLLNELLAGTSDEAAYVHLSDGGHFENMALYEMVKRRCGLIVLCDAEQDEKYEYRGLGNAIRKCRIDLGIDIDLNVKDITPEKDGQRSKRHCAVGTIHYEQADLKAPAGKIVYFKASLTGDESTDLKNYGTRHDSFPHESTIDQWFSESQFEAYRKLGYHEVMTSLPGVPSADNTPPIDAAQDPLCKELYKIFDDFGFAPHAGVRPAKLAC